ncbi:protein of unknown function [Paraburkholderia dioscoreae]|uniref:Uncharacterized protein n=1 Tax=Paraburkholderia dioscoreae TaxID=2604047 RepID=A0A5Q4YXI3_9BURK|nr:protein of unknown function [Paraburkholderia dioscoreae]
MPAAALAPLTFSRLKTTFGGLRKARNTGLHSGITLRYDFPIRPDGQAYVRQPRQREYSNVSAASQLPVRRKSIIEHDAKNHRTQV